MPAGRLRHTASRLLGLKARRFLAAAAAAVVPVERCTCLNDKLSGMLRSRDQRPLFTALHVMQTRSSDENSVRLSVTRVDWWIVTKRKKDMSRFLYHTKDNLA